MLNCSLCKKQLDLPHVFATKYSLEEFAQFFTSWLKTECGWTCSDCKLKVYEPKCQIAS